MNIREDFVDILCQINPEYEHHVRYEMGGSFVSISAQENLWLH